jgi:hypothetical protein
MLSDCSQSGHHNGPGDGDGTRMIGTSAVNQILSGSLFTWGKEETMKLGSFPRTKFIQLKFNSSMIIAGDELIQWSFTR